MSMIIVIATYSNLSVQLNVANNSPSCFSLNQLQEFAKHMIKMLYTFHRVPLTYVVLAVTHPQWASKQKQSMQITGVLKARL